MLSHSQTILEEEYMIRFKKNPIRRFALLCCVLLTFSSYAGFHLKPLTTGSQDSFDEEEAVDNNEYWDEIKETVNSPDRPQSAIKYLSTFFLNEISSDGFSYIYGGKTANKIQNGTSKTYSNILSCYFDNNDYSGVSLVLGNKKTFDLESLRKEKASGLAFWAKGSEANEQIFIGLVDDESDGMKVQSRVALRDFGKIDTSWKYFMIPLKKFNSNGKYWDDNRRMEVVKEIDWRKISEVRFSTNKGENHPDPKAPVKLYVEHVGIIDDIPGYFDPDKYWQTFVSNEPDRLLHDFEFPTDQNWTTASGSSSQIKISMANPSNGKYGRNSLSVNYHLGDWCDVMYDYKGNGIPDSKCDWTKYWGLKLHIFSNRPFQAINLQVSDAGDELYIASCGGPEGWSEIIVPFKDFYKFPYYQPADAVHNGKFDLEKIRMLDIKPAGEGTAATFMIDNISLTNDRVAKTETSVSEKSVVISGSFNSVITKKVNDGIFGINTQHWDGDLLNPTTAQFVKPLNHSVLRFPGGLSSDEYHWKTALAKKDADVDIDEFMDFCKKIGCEPMITVNFGTGTPQEAAEWVEYLNINKKKHVRYWEVGNELYGDWHHNHCSADQYGKRAVEFINAMKKVDPNIFITVVWELQGEWNKTVFGYVKGIADGVNVHNYPQESGEENDINLLASPQTLNEIIPGVRRQLSEYGEKDKYYQIWLTEWNSVDFNPTPQSLSIVNGLFVADYLGMLSKYNIEQASYWNIHNGLFEQGGDYGYLSRGDFPGGVNIPRPSYWAFKEACGSLRGTLVRCGADDKYVTAYANLHEDGSKSLLLINKYPKTSVNATITIPEFSGKGVMSQLTEANSKAGAADKSVEIKSNAAIQLPPYSITRIQLK